MARLRRWAKKIPEPVHVSTFESSMEFGAPSIPKLRFEHWSKTRQNTGKTVGRCTRPNSRAIVEEDPANNGTPADQYDTEFLAEGSKRTLLKQKLRFSSRPQLEPPKAAGPNQEYFQIAASFGNAFTLAVFGAALRTTANGIRRTHKTTKAPNKTQHASRHRCPLFARAVPFRSLNRCRVC